MNVSACIICLNEERHIAAALDSLAWCDDVVVVDSGSTDRTAEIVRNHSTKPRFIYQKWLGHNPQKRFAAEQCRNRWVLIVDADEECTPELAREIQALPDDPTAAIYAMPRKNYVGQRYVRCWSPDDQERLIHLDRIDWDPALAPEKQYPRAGLLRKKLKSPLLHSPRDPWSFRDVADGRRMELYAITYSETMLKRGKRANFLNLVFRPLMAFIKYYVIKGGFLDGSFGLIICYRTTIGVMLKYSALYVREANMKNDTETRQRGDAENSSR